MNLRFTLGVGLLCAGVLRAQSEKPAADAPVRLDKITVCGASLPGLLDILP